MKLTLGEIETCFQTLIAMLRSRGIDSIDTGPQDLFWTVTSDDWMDFTGEPKPAVDSHDDNFQAIKNLLSGQTPASLVDLDRLAAVLRLLGDDSPGRVD